MARSRGLLVVVYALVCGCDYFTPEVGPEQTGRCVNADHDIDTEVSFAADIVPILEEHCYHCHLPTSPTPVGFEIGGLDMTSYTTLRAGGVMSGEDVVIDGAPCESVLIQKVSDAPPFGARMPADGPPYLDEDELDLLHDWIAEGAGGS